jgi:predicted regulator of Ras-like GTPase activity (Roadblock/LC7/MglB family)
MLKSILEEFLAIEGVTGAVVVGRDGFLIEGARLGKIDLEAVGAMASTGMGSSEAMGTELSRGKLLQMHMELDKGFIIIAPLTDTEFVTIIADTLESSGRIRHALKKNRERLIAAL